MLLQGSTGESSVVCTRSGSHLPPGGKTYGQERPLVAVPAKRTEGLTRVDLCKHPVWVILVQLHYCSVFKISKMICQHLAGPESSIPLQVW